MDNEEKTKRQQVIDYLSAIKAARDAAWRIDTCRPDDAPPRLAALDTRAADALDYLLRIETRRLTKPNTVIRAAMLGEWE